VREETVVVEMIVAKECGNEPLWAKLSLEVLWHADGQQEQVALMG
jgi:hypothetical protein